MIMVRTLRKDIAKYNRDEDLVGLFIKHFAHYAAFMLCDIQVIVVAEVKWCIPVTSLDM